MNNSAYVDLVFFRTGWVFRVFVFQLRYNRQDNYSALSIEKIGVSYRNTKGITWKEFREARAKAKFRSASAKAEA